MNKRKLEQIAKWLEAGAPHRGNIVGFNMEYFRTLQVLSTDNVASWRRGDSLRPGETVPADCGTVCCIAGAAIQFNEDSKSPKNVDPIDNFATAKQLLGLSYWQASALFYGEVQDEDGDTVSAVRLDRITPAWAARCIRKLIETGEVDWLGTEKP